MAAIASLSRPLPALKNLLFPTDLSATSEAAFPYACALAKHAGATLHVLHVVGPRPEGSIFGMPSRKVQEEDKSARERLAHVFRSALLRNIECKSHLCRGVVWEEVCRGAIEQSIDLIVLGSSGVHVPEQSLGSVAEQIFRGAECPVVVIGPKIDPARVPKGRFSTVLLAMSYSPPSRKALEYALALTCAHDCTLVLLNVLDTELTDGAPDDYLQTAMSNSEKQLPELIPKGMTVRSEVVVKCGIPAEVIVETAKEKNSELVVMGTRRDVHMAAHVKRTTVHSVLCDSPCPVMAIAL